MAEEFSTVDEIYDSKNEVKEAIKKDYVSVKEMCMVEMDVKKSRFIAVAFHVENEDEVHQLVGNLRKSNKNAKHFAYAYVLNDDYSVAKSNDDGEPAGSAGAPIYEAIRNWNLTNTLVVVVRYFGGKELGKGRLTRVYNAVANGVLSSAVKFKMLYCNEIEIKVSYQNYGAVNKLFSDSNVHIIEQTNDEQMPVMKIAVPVNASERIVQSVKARTRGAGAIIKYGTGYYKFAYEGNGFEKVDSKDDSKDSGKKADSNDDNNKDNNNDNNK